MGLVMRADNPERLVEFIVEFIVSYSEKLVVNYALAKFWLIATVVSCVLHFGSVCSDNAR
uniref:Uncharacterized protein n=1 Tax=Candidatus Kentrum sp. LFY TaxID=2126342 RepID=A0A450UZ79_9GAMM|nr:MAG: hypothetical protein BECKLFY1418A_GA0070994_10745 [Candidatus Kentron sp. LFY]